VPAGWRWDGRSLTRRKAAVSFYVGPIQVYADPCQWSHAASRKSGSVKAIANALAAQPDRYATRPRSIPQGLPGAVGPTWDTIAVRLTVPSNLDLSACVRGQYRTWTNGRVTRFQQGAGQRDLIWLAAMGNAPLIVDASTYPDTSARLVRQVDAILASVKAGGFG
jgi:hypothetical protein